MLCSPGGCIGHSHFPCAPESAHQSRHSTCAACTGTMGGFRALAKRPSPVAMHVSPLNRNKSASFWSCCRIVPTGCSHSPSFRDENKNKKKNKTKNKKQNQPLWVGKAVVVAPTKCKNKNRTARRKKRRRRGARCSCGLFLCGFPFWVNETTAARMTTFQNRHVGRIPLSVLHIMWLCALFQFAVMRVYFVALTRNVAWQAAFQSKARERGKILEGTATQKSMACHITDRECPFFPTFSQTQAFANIHKHLQTFANEQRNKTKQPKPPHKPPHGTFQPRLRVEQRGCSACDALAEVHSTISATRAIGRHGMATRQVALALKFTWGSPRNAFMPSPPQTTSAS